MVYRTPKQDSTTGASVVIDYAHNKVHGGNSFVCHYSQTVSDTNDKSIVAFKTGSTKYIHLSIAAAASTAAIAYIYEAPTITNGYGTLLTVYNRRRVGTPTASTIIETTTCSEVAGNAMYFSETDMGEVTGGTELAHIPLVSGAGPKILGGTARDTQEWILKPDTLYAFVVHSTTDLDNTHWIEANWYEHEEL